MWLLCHVLMWIYVYVNNVDYWKQVLKDLLRNLNKSFTYTIIKTNFYFVFQLFTHRVIEKYTIEEI